MFEKWRSWGRCNDCRESAAIDACHLTKGCLGVSIYIYNSDREEEKDTRICSLAPANLPLSCTKLLLNLKAQSSLRYYFHGAPDSCCVS